MTIFDHRRLTNQTFQLDVERLRRGFYTDKYFENVQRILHGVSVVDVQSPRDLPFDPATVNLGEMIIEAQIFCRRQPRGLIAGIDMALAMLRHCTGYYDANDQFVETWDHLQVDAVNDGVFTYFDGDPFEVQTVLEIRGRYRDFAVLETPILGVLARATRTATNVFELLEVINGKPLLFFPARFDVPEVQALDGYAYHLAVQRYNADYSQQNRPIVSTDAQASWWGGRGGGTVPHALISTFMADSVAAMVAFAQHIPVGVPRIQLADFNNDVVKSTLDTMAAYWPNYVDALERGDKDKQQRWTLNGTRLDTSGKLIDKSLQPGGPPGVNAELVRLVRDAIDGAWEAWDVPEKWREIAIEYCKGVSIVVSGGFTREKIQSFEEAGVPVGSYGVGSSLLRNDSDTNADFTMDLVRVKVDGQWHDMAKIGRQPCDNPDLVRINLENF